MPETIRIAALYRFARFDDPAALRAAVLARCDALGIKGTLLLAREGINGTIAGPPAAIDAILRDLRALPGCADLAPKFSAATTAPFHRMKVRIKREIVTMGVADLDPNRAGTHVGAGDWNALIAAPGTLLIDTRNAYEVRVGSFADAIDPATASFAEFPDWVAANRAALEGADRIAMFCTGGIRCEKATAYLRREGLDRVFHLDGGILAYLENVPAEDSRWTGECFVFDSRVAVTHGLSLGSHTLCHACRMPVAPDERRSPSYEEGVRCPHCHDLRSDAQRAAYAERHRQERIAAAQGVRHVGARFDGPAGDPAPSPR